MITGKGIVDFDTHGLDWRRHLRDAKVFHALVTPGWHRDALMQRQLAYARQLQKPIVFLVKDGTTLPTMHEGEHVHPWATSEELAAIIARMLEEDTP
jgi:hypothetical protein